MSDTDGPLIRRAAVAACLFLTFAAPAFAQYPQPPGFAPAPASPDYLTRYDFHLSASKLGTDDTRLVWSTHFGGDFDAVDYVFGRATILFDYETVIGSEFRTIDPNQGNHTLEPSVSLRAGKTEVALVFHHVSRHLGDRPKRFAIDWNVLGARVMRRMSVHGATADITVGGGRFVQRSSVDYTWTGNVDVLVRRPVNQRVGTFARATGETFGTDPELLNRGRQTGGTVEGGLRLNGAGGAVELFGGYERRIDADPIDNQSHSWPIVGFRFVSR